MKISKYTFLFEYKQIKYAYNTLSNSLIEIDNVLYSNLINKNIIKLDDETQDLLLKHSILTRNDKDDFLIYKSNIQNQREINNFMHLTVAPTMDCCFKCHYCFEKYKSPLHMDEGVMNSIVNYLSSQKQLKRIKLTWFGGEPLMAIDEIKLLYRKITTKLPNLKTSSNIITTGYHLNLNIINTLKEVGVSSIQITLDGGEKTHNKIKFLKECPNVFDKVINNILLLNDNAPEIHVTIRVNLTLKNSKEYRELCIYLQKKLENRNNISITPAFVLDRSLSNVKKTNVFFNHNQRSEYILDLAKDGYNVNNLLFPGHYFTECAIRNKSAIAFDPEGYVYKCWEVIGNKKYNVGKLDEKGQIINVNQTILNRQLYGADPLDDPKCKECNYLPICNGGCPIQRIENEFEGGHNDNCTYYKNYIEDFIRMHLKVKEKLSQKV